MRPLLYMWSVLDQNVVKWRMTVVYQHNYSTEICGSGHGYKHSYKIMTRAMKQ